jgi:hypothetical protein
MDDFEEYVEFEDENAFVDYLIEIGILEEEGFDEDGEVTYVYNFEKMKDLMPELYDEIMNGLNENLMILFEQDLIKVEYDEELRAHISPTDEGMEYFKLKYGEE